jgi:methionyl-tRNA formyltransferase
VRTVFLGTSEFAAAILRGLADTAHRPALVISRPDRPRGRGRRLSAPPAADAARELGIPLEQPESVNSRDARALIAEHRPEAVCVCAFGALIKDPLLSEYEMINVHPSLLPRWRGAAPIERAIMAGDEATGVSIMRLTAGLDSGPVGLQREQPILDEDTYGTLSSRLQAVGSELLVQALDTPPQYEEQDDSEATYAEKIAPADRMLDAARDATELDRVVRALTPHIGARLALPDGTVLGIGQARATVQSGPPQGTLAFEGEVPVLGCAAGSLELLAVQPPGRRMMSGADYLRGRR